MLASAQIISCSSAPSATPTPNLEPIPTPAPTTGPVATATLIPTPNPALMPTATPAAAPTPSGTDPIAFFQCATQAVGKEIASNTAVIEGSLSFLGSFDPTGLTDAQFDALFTCAEQDVGLAADLGQAATAIPTPALAHATNPATLAWLEGVGWSDSEALALAEKVRASTLVVRVATVPGGEGVGAGWVAAPGLVITNGHVTPEVGATVTLETITGAHFSALVLESSLQPDLAILRVTTNVSLLPPPLPLGTTSPGNPVMAVGHPGNVGNWVVTVGEVASVDLDYWILADISVSQGNSGGPAVNRNGEVVGVVSGGSLLPAFTGVYDLVIIRDLNDYAPASGLTTIELGAFVAAMVERHQ